MSVTRVTALPEKSYCAAPALASPSANPDTKHPIIQSHPDEPFHALRLPGGDRALSDDSYAMMTAMRQLGRPLGKSFKGEMSKISTYGTTGITRRGTPPNEAARPFRTTGPDGRGDRGRSPRFT